MDSLIGSRVAGKLVKILELSCDSCSVEISTPMWVDSLWPLGPGQTVSYLNGPLNHHDLYLPSRVGSLWAPGPDHLSKRTVVSPCMIYILH